MPLHSGPLWSLVLPYRVHLSHMLLQSRITIPLVTICAKAMGRSPDRWPSPIGPALSVRPCRNVDIGGRDLLRRDRFARRRIYR